MVLFIIKICTNDPKNKEIFIFFISTLINILDILLDLAFLLSALYQFSYYKWINLIIFLFHPAFFYLFGIYYFFKGHREKESCCNFLIKLIFFPIIFCIFNLVGIFGSPNNILKGNEILKYCIDLDLEDKITRKKFKVNMKIVDLMCETVPEIALIIVVNISSDNWGYFQIFSLIIDILNLLYCSYVILVEFMEIEDLSTNNSGQPQCAGVLA